MSAPILNIPSSTAPDVRQWIFDQCTQYMTPDPGNPDANLMVCFDDPGPYQPDDIVAIGEVVRAFEPGSFVGGGGAKWLKERYTITVTIDVYRGTDDANAVYRRAQLLADTVVAIVRNDLSLGGNVITGKPLADSGKGEWDPDHKGRHWLSTVEISCYAQI